MKIINIKILTLLFSLTIFSCSTKIKEHYKNPIYFRTLIMELSKNKNNYEVFIKQNYPNLEIKEIELFEFHLESINKYEFDLHGTTFIFDDIKNNEIKVKQELFSSHRDVNRIVSQDTIQYYPTRTMIFEFKVQGKNVILENVYGVRE